MDKQYLQVVEHKDEQGRMFCTPTFYRVEKRKEGCMVSHGISYLQARMLLQDHGVVMGLEEMVFTKEEEEWLKQIDCSG